MTQEIINIGSAELAGDGEPLRSAFSKINTNFAELFSANNAALEVSDTAPVNPKPGNLWYDTVSGNTYVYYSNTWVDTNSAVIGPPGNVGPTGPQGDASTVPGPTGPSGADSTVAGPTGPQGDVGPTGPQGDASTVAGPTGPQGDVGPTGSQGDAGPTGPAGTDFPSLVRFYVNPYMVNESYTATGSIGQPFRTISAALNHANDLINQLVIQPNLTSPVYIILQGSINESITLNRGHVFLVGEGSTINSPVYLTGTITVDGSIYQMGFDDNHYSIQGITVVAPPNEVCIHFTGSVGQQLYLQDVSLFANGTGTGLLMDNIQPQSIVNGANMYVSHFGTGDIYCIDVQQGTAGFLNLATSNLGASQIVRVGSGANLILHDSFLVASGEVILESYGGLITLLNCRLYNTNSTNDSYGIWLHDNNSSVIMSNCFLSVFGSTQNSRAIKGVAGSTVYHAYTSFAPSTNTRRDSAISMIALSTNFTAV